MRDTCTYSRLASRASWAFSRLMFAGPLKTPRLLRTERQDGVDYIFNVTKYVAGDGIRL